MLTIIGNLDSANPRDDGIEQTAEGRFTLRAYSETDQESFRLEVRIRNRSAQPRPITLDIMWPTVPFSELRDCFYWKHDADQDWSPRFASTAPGRSSISFAVPPGEGWFCLHPHYGYDDCEAWIRSLRHPLLEASVAGMSEKGRAIPLLRVAASPDEEARPSILVAARNHANESSGNYCVEGMLSWLFSEESLARYALTRFRFYFLPMTNPDGVADGMARFTRPEGADLNRQPEWLRANRPDSAPDKSHETFYATLDKLRPTMFLNLHSYLFKHKDELYGADTSTIEHFIRFMPDQIELGKVWRRTVSDGTLTFPTGYCQERFGALAFLVEIPWFGRTACAMRETGRRLLRALLLSKTVAKDRDWGEF